ncbi:MAG: DUF6612 family protein, partial [Chloroflexota bacterium]
MRRKACAVLTSLLVMALLVASAVGGGCKKEPASDLTVENVVARTAQAALNLKSYVFDLEMAMHMAGVVDGEAGDMTVSLKGDGAIDLKDREMGVELVMSMKGKAGDETLDETMEIATYIVGDMAYQGTADEEGEMHWQSQAVPSGTWNQMQVEQQMELLEKSKVKLLKAEKVGSIQCYVVELEPDLGALWETVMQQPAMGG